MNKEDWIYWLKLKLKAFVLLLRYNLRGLRRVFRQLPYLLFLLSLILFAIALVPNAGMLLSQSKLFSYRPQSFSVKGTISEEINEPDRIIKPISGVTVEIGGYQTKTNSDGVYSLEFRAQRTKEIPIIFLYGEKEIIHRISVPEGTNQLEKDVTFK